MHIVKALFDIEVIKTLIFNKTICCAYLTYVQQLTELEPAYGYYAGSPSWRSKWRKIFLLADGGAYAMVRKQMPLAERRQKTCRFFQIH